MLGETRSWVGGGDCKAGHPLGTQLPPSNPPVPPPQSSLRLEWVFLAKSNKMKLMYYLLLLNSICYDYLHRKAKMIYRL